MSRQLPEKPNLEYLKKQAKELLRSMPQGKLADAQHALANDYGFPSWAKLKSYVEGLGLRPAEALKAAVCESDATRVLELLGGYPELGEKIDDPLPDYGFGEHALFAALQRSDRATIDVLLRAGANVRKRTEWWAGGFGVLDDCDPSLVEFLTERGAELDAHAASRLGMLPKLRQLVEADSGVVHARGGDGQTPLHFASTVEVAEFLLTNGADIDARDIDHESTPAQYMLRVGQKRLPAGPTGCGPVSGIARLPDRHLDGGGAGRCRSRAASPGCRSEMHPHERLGGVVSEAKSASGRHDLHLDAGGAPDRARGGARFRSRGSFPVAVE